MNPKRLRDEVRLELLIPAAAKRAAQALEVLGCELTFVGESTLKIHPSAQVNPADLSVLIAAGEESGIWVGKL